MFQAEEYDGIGPLRVRMGIHTGESVERKGDYFGPAPSRASRLMSVASGGQVLVSAASRGSFEELFSFLEIPIPPDDLDQLLEAYSFRRLSGRQPGTEDVSSHLRSGRAGGWSERLDDDLLAYLAERSGDLLRHF